MKQQGVTTEVASGGRCMHSPSADLVEEGSRTADLAGSASAARQAMPTPILSQKARSASRQALARKRASQEANQSSHTDDDLTLLFVEDLAAMFHIGLAAARKRLRLGLFGPYLAEGRRRAVLKRSLLEYLRKSQVEIG